MFLKILTIAVTFFIGITQLSSQTADEIAAKVLETRGDVATYKNLNSLVISGSQAQMGMIIPIKLCIKKISDKVTKYYLESEAMGSKQSMGFDGDTLWAFRGQLQSASAKDVPEEEIKGFIQQITQIRDFAETPLLRYKDKGHTLELSGSVNEDGRDAYTIKLIHKEEREIFLYIDKTNYELFKIWFTMQGQNGEEIEVDMNYSDYKKVNGFSIPHKMSLKTGDFGTIDMTLEKVEYNPVIDDSIFRVPR